MPTITLTYPNVIRVRPVLVIGLVAILILTSLALTAGVISSTASSTTRAGYQADRIPVVQNSVPAPPTVEIETVLSETTVSTSVVAGEPFVPVSVPTPPF